MTRGRCPWRRRGQVLRTLPLARSPLLARLFLQDKTPHPARTALQGRNMFLHCLVKTQLPAKSPLLAKKPCRARTPHQTRDPLQPQPSHPARTFLMVKDLPLARTLCSAKTSLPSQDPLLRTFRPIKTCLQARSPCQLRSMSKRPQALGSHQQPLPPCL